MDYVALLTMRPGTTTEDRDGALARRATWQYPEGIDPIAEYWPVASNPQVVSIFSAEDFGPVMELMMEWNDAFEIDVHPAVSADEGLKLGPDVFGRLPRMQQQ